MAISRLGKTLAIWAVLAAALLVISAAAESKARIVRLSEVRGSVQMDRGTGEGFEKTFLNMPVIEGSKLKTGDDGRAEVEFEDGSAFRIVPNSEVEFTRLALGDDGQRLSTMRLSAGTAYVNSRGKKGDQFTLNFGRESITLTESAHFRVGVANDEATLAVFKGRLNVTGQSGPFEISEKHSATFDIRSDRYDLAKNYAEDPYDDWDKQQSEYHDRYAASGNSYNGSSPYAYGMSDLNYYGSYMMVPGYGMVWQPYFLNAGWSPFQDGGWVWYPGYGYMWVSGYPWGWMPYRYGNWAFVPGYGWVWQPGYWNAWYAVPRVVNPPRRTVIPQPPVRTRSTVMLGKGLTVNPPAGPPQRLTITPGSAGLGVPRGTVRNLDRLAREVNKSERPVEVRTEPSGRIAPRSRSTTGSLNSPASGTRPPSSASPPSQVSTPRMTPPPAPSRMPSAPPARSSKPH
ncbi:MAG: FecR family protein [Terriglobales bacterium]